MNIRLRRRQWTFFVLVLLVLLVVDFLWRSRTSSYYGSLVDHSESRLVLKIDGLNGSCQEASLGNHSVSLPVPYNVSYQDIPSHIWQDLSGNAARNSSFAVCAFDDSRKWSNHLPHTMQQLYKCFSYWQAYPTKQPILIHTIKEHSKFVKGFNVALEKVFGVKMIKNGTTSYAETAVVPAVIPPYALLKQHDARVLSAGLVRHYFGRANVACPAQGPRISILDRAKSRTLLNVHGLRDALQATFSSSVRIAYFEESQFLDQVHFFTSSDIVVSPHGAQLTGLALLPACSGLLEVQPARYFHPEYFQSLARAAGVSHMLLYLSNSSDPVGETALTRQQGKVDYYRNQNLCPPLETVVESVAGLVQLYKECCARQQP